jgi:hypothetical protein
MSRQANINNTKKVPNLMAVRIVKAEKIKYLTSIADCYKSCSFGIPFPHDVHWSIQ